MTCKSVLVVDDDEDIREGIAYVLEREGYSVAQAENGRVALDLLRSLTRQTLPGCIVLDLMMPVMDGRALLEALHSLHPDDLGKIPVLIASAKPDLASEIKPLPGAPEHLRKPLELDELFAAIEQHCGKPVWVHGQPSP